MFLYVCITVGENSAESAVDTTIHSRHFLWLFLQKEKKKEKKTKLHTRRAILIPSRKKIADD